jgi:hypothetical protein
VIAGYLDGEVQPIGRLDDSIGSIHFAKDDIDTLARKGRADASLDAISQHEAAEWIDCDPMAVQGLAKNGLLVAVHGRHRTRIMRRTVEAFVSRYVSLSGLANELTTTVLKLKNLCKSLSINVMLITRTTAKHSAFIARDRMEALVSALNDSRPEKRQTSIELLTQYLVYLRQTGQPLPRKGAVPNRAAIAYACGFDRNVLYDNKPVIQALQEFDEEDALRHALRPRIAPFEELRRYLENLRQSDAPLPCRKGKPNKVAIARAVGFKRDVLYTDPRFDRLIESYLNSTDPRQALRASNHNLSSEN